MSKLATRKKLGELCSVVTKGTTPTSLGMKFEDEGVPFLRIQNLSGSSVHLKDILYISEDTHNALNRSKIMPGDFLITIAGTIGRVAIVPDDFPEANCNQAVAILRFDKSKLLPRYLLHWLTTNDALRQISGKKVTATISNLSLGQIKELEIPLPPLDEQKRIAAILDKADAIRRKRQQAIQLADDFLRSVFLDMFGDPVTNPKGWEVKSLKDIAKIQIGPFGTQLHKEDYIEGGIPLINPTHIVKGNIVPKTNLSVSNEKHATLSEYHLKVGDIIMGRRGEMGRCAIVNEKEAGWICGTGSLYIRPNKAGVFSEYLNKLLSSQAIKNHLESESQGATMPNLNKNIVGNIQIPVPSDEVLDDFTRLKVKFLKLTETSQNFANEMIFESLSQKAFAGEL